MPTTQNYPSLASLVSTDVLPDQLGFVEDGIEQLLSKVFLKDLQVLTSPGSGDKSFYAKLLIFEKVGFELPGIGLGVYLNAGDAPGTTEFPISLQTRLGVLSFLRGFSFEKFAGDSPSFFGAVLNILDIAPVEVLDAAVTHLTEDREIDTLIDNINAFAPYSSPGLTYPASTDYYERLEDLAAQIDSNGSLPDTYQVVFDVYISEAESFDDALSLISRLFDEWFGSSAVSTLRYLLTPRFDASLQIDVEVVVPRTILVPLQPNGEEYPDPARFVIRSLPSTFDFSSTGVVGFRSALAVTTGIDTDPLVSGPTTRIGNTGFTFSFENIWIDLSDRANIPPLAAAGFREDFRGVFIEEATIGLPDFFHNDSTNDSTGVVRGRNLVIGTGGFSGTLSLEAIDPDDATIGAPLLKKRIGNNGFAVELDSFNVVFERGAILSGGIAGKLFLPGFKKQGSNDPAEVGITAHICQDGQFKLTASTPEGLTVRVPNVFDLTLNSLSLGHVERDGDKMFYVEASGRIKITAQVQGFVGDLLPGEIVVQSLRIWQDGKFEIQGGGIPLPRALTLKLGPAKISVTGLSLGAYVKDGRQYRFFGFDGGINVNPGGVDARGDGIQLHFTVDDGPLDVFIRIQRLDIEIVIPGSANRDEAAVIISGYLAMKDSPQGLTEYTGGVSFSMPKTGVSGGAAMRYTPGIPAFIMEASLQLPAPIVLGTTGLGIYGFEALFGAHYTPDKLDDPDESWYEFYRKDPLGLNVLKYTNEDPGTSIGAGAVLGTLDDGYSFSSRVFLAVTVPEVKILIMGQGNVLARRIGLDGNDEPPFFALVGISEQSVEVSLGANYKLPRNSGDIVKIEALAQMAYYFGKPSAWFIHFGTKDKPINAEVFQGLFRAYAYLMVNSRELSAGAGWHFEQSFGLEKIVTLFVTAGFDVHGRISFRPVQIGGAIDVYGSGGVRVFGMPIQIKVVGGFYAEAPKPFVIGGYLGAEVPFPSIFKKKKKKKKKQVRIELEWRKDSSVNTAPVDFLLPTDVEGNTLPPAQWTTNPAAAKNIHTLETYRLAYNGSQAIPNPASWIDNGTSINPDFAHPLDTYIDLSFTKNVLPDVASSTMQRFGMYSTAPSPADFRENVPPSHPKGQQVEHEYVVKNVAVKYWDGSTWKDYDLYSSLPNAAIATQNLSPSQLASLKYGAWQAIGPAGEYAKLRLHATTPFSFVNSGHIGAGVAVPDVTDFGYTASQIYCEQELLQEECLKWTTLETPVGTLYPWQPTFDRKAWVRAGASFGQVVDIDTSLSGLFPSLPLGQYLAITPNFPNAFAGMLTPIALLGNVPISFSNGDTFHARLEVEIPEPSVMASGQGYANGQVYVTYYRKVTPIGYIPVQSQIIPAQGVFSFEYNNPSQPIDKVVISKWSVATQFFLSTTGGEESTGDLDEDIRRIQQRMRWHEMGQHAQWMLLESLTSRNTLDFTVVELLILILLAILLGGSFLMSEVCWLTLAAYEYNQLQEQFNQQVPQMVDTQVNMVANVVQPIWRPNTHFAIQVEMLDTVKHQGNVVSASPVFANFGFRTLGPIGFYDQKINPAGYSAAEASGEADRLKTANLKHYVNFERSYPNADGNLVGAKPLYRGDDAELVHSNILLFFNRDYVNTMFNVWPSPQGSSGMPEWRYRLGLEIMDSRGDAIAEPSATWEDNPTVSFQENDVQIFLEMNGQQVPCLQQTVDIQKSKHLRYQLPILEPLKLYTAVFSAELYDASPEAATLEASEVHRFVFQSSRYHTFAEHVLSYNLLEDSKALYTRHLDMTAIDFSSLADTLGTFPYGTTDELVMQYPLPFDRVLYGIFQFPQEAPPTRTTVTLLRLLDAETGLPQDTQVAALWVQSPEPFNDPKMPPADVAGTLAVTGDGVSDAIVLYSKDLSQMLVFAAGAGYFDSGTTPEITLGFVQKLYNGDQYLAPNAPVEIIVPLA